VGRTNIDDVMTTGRTQVQAAARELLQGLMDDYEGGLEITEVNQRVLLHRARAKVRRALDRYFGDGG